ncbi:hypothetical protein [Variovorax sp. JS1663]|uniref:hypothetical protein n=1 Tax=Variovorax sp. JS1663 TaxID=1851577 RepID=UPI00117EE480|nr:hypothetical protein [Variovorax sp. JS1663]
MNDLYLFAMANLVICGVIVFISLCRLNAMQNGVLWRVRLEYAGYLGGAVASGLQPWWGEYPEWGSICIATSLLIGLLCSNRAWRGDRPPRSATGPMPLETLDED